jgi:hypothetical protein
MSNKREIIRLPEVPRSRTPEPALKRPRKSRATSKSSVPKSSRHEESTAVATRSVRSPAAREPAPRGASRGRPARTPSAEWSSGEESVAAGSLPAAERSSGEEIVAVVGSPGSEPRTPPVERSSGEEPVAEGLLPAAERCSGEVVAVVGNIGPYLRTLDATMTSTAAITAEDGRSGLARRTTVVERSLGEEPVTSGMLEGLRPSGEAEPVTSCMPPAERSSGEVHAADVDSDQHTAIGAHPQVDRAPTGVLETVVALTEPFHASRTPSAYRALARTDTEAEVPGMNTTAGGPIVDRTPTGGGETLALTSAPVTEEPRGEPAMVETFTPRIGAVTQDSKVETSPGRQ